VLARLAVLLFIFLLSLPAVAGAAVPTNVRRVIADFRNDGRIEPCRHMPKDYRDTLEEVQAGPEAYAPDFPIAVQAAREARVEASCEKEQEKQAEENAAPEPKPDDKAAVPPPASQPPAVATPAPTTAPAPAPVVPALPKANPPATVKPAPSASPTPIPEVAPAPTAVPGAGITPGLPPATNNKPEVVLTRTTDNREARLPLGILAGLLAAALLAGLLALLMRRFGWGEERLAGLRHSWGEASYRTGGTWQNFTDWVRLGR
jgi:outer membrane biosynthesis protein TonB